MSDHKSTSAWGSLSSLQMWGRILLRCNDFAPKRLMVAIRSLHSPSLTFQALCVNPAASFSNNCWTIIKLVINKTQEIKPTNKVLTTGVTTTSMMLVSKVTTASRTWSFWSPSRSNKVPWTKRKTCFHQHLLTRCLFENYKCIENLIRHFFFTMITL